MKPTLILWVLDFLTNRSQYVKVNGASPSSVNTNAGAPQGSVISPVLYTMYTSGKCYLPCTVHPVHLKEVLSHPVHLREVLSPLYCTPCTRVIVGQSNRTARTYFSNMPMIYVWLDSSAVTTTQLMIAKLQRGMCELQNYIHACSCWLLALSWVFFAGFCTLYF